MKVTSESYRDANRRSVMEVIHADERTMDRMISNKPGDAAPVASLVIFTENGDELGVHHPLRCPTVNSRVIDLMRDNPGISEVLGQRRVSGRIALTREQCVELGTTLLLASGVEYDIYDSVDDEPSPDLFFHHGLVDVEC